MKDLQQKVPWIIGLLNINKTIRRLFWCFSLFEKVFKCNIRPFRFSLLILTTWWLSSVVWIPMTLWCLNIIHIKVVIIIKKDFRLFGNISLCLPRLNFFNFVTWPIEFLYTFDFFSISQSRRKSACIQELIFWFNYSLILKFRSFYNEKELILPWNILWGHQEWQ